MRKPKGTTKRGPVRTTMTPVFRGGKGRAKGRSTTYRGRGRR